MRTKTLIQQPAWKFHALAKALLLGLTILTSTPVAGDQELAANEKERLQRQIKLAHKTNFEPVIMAYIHFPPFSFTDENGKPGGLVVQYAESLLQEFELEYQFLEIPVTRLYQRLLNGDLHFWLGSKGTPALREMTISSKKPYGYLRVMVYGASGQAPPKLDALTNTILITIQGYQYSGLLKRLVPAQKVSLLSAQDHMAAFAMLNSGRGHYVLDYEGPSLNAIETLGLQDLSSRMVSEIPSYMVVSKRAPEPELLLAVLESASKHVPLPTRTRPKN